MSMIPATAIITTLDGGKDLQLKTAAGQPYNLALVEGEGRLYFGPGVSLLSDKDFAPGREGKDYCSVSDFSGARLYAPKKNAQGDEVDLVYDAIAAIPGGCRVMLKGRLTHRKRGGKNKTWGFDVYEVQVIEQDVLQLA